MFNIDRALNKITNNKTNSMFDIKTNSMFDIKTTSKFGIMTNIPKFNTAKFLTAQKSINMDGSVKSNTLPNLSSFFNSSLLVVKNPFNNKVKNGASLNMQHKWSSMSSNKRNQLRKILPDIDGDRVPDRYDCQPNNIMRQDWKLPEGFNKEGVDKYDRKIVYMPTEDLYYMRGRYGPGGDTKINIYGDDRSVMKEMEEIGFEEKWQQDYNNMEYEDYIKQRDTDIINYQAEIKRKELEKQGYKVYPNKIGIIKGGMFGNTEKFGTTLKFRSSPQKYQKDIQIVMKPTNFAPESSTSDRDSKKVKKYYNELKQELETGEIPMIQLSDSEIRRGVTGSGRHRILAARELGLKEIPVIVDNITAEKRLQNFPQGLQKEKHIPDKTKTWKIPDLNDNEYYTDVPKLKAISKQEAKTEVYNKYKEQFESNNKKDDIDEEVELLLLRHKILNEAEDNYLKDMEGASIEKQNEWKEMPQDERNEARDSLPDIDGDRVPDKYDCCPDNTMKQDTQIYLDPNSKNTAYVKPAKYPDDIYLGDMPYSENVDRVADILHHEEMHKALYDEFGDYTSRGYDYITAPNIKPYNWEMNPKTGGNLYGSPTSAKEAIREELAEKSYAYNPWEKKLDEDYYGNVKERLKLAKEYMTEDEKRNLGIIKENNNNDINIARNALLGGL